MRRLCNAIGLISALLGNAGCKHETILRPPKPPEEYRVPPDDSRYTNPPQPPKDLLNVDPGKTKSGDPGTPGSMGRQGQGRMGGMGAQ